ncbi:MAG: Fic family protein [Acidobacteriota bacterium]|nr:Fic family protein [Acidobacteriota bacterium]
MGTRRTYIADGITQEQYPRSHAPTDLIGNLKFAMRHEPLDLAVLRAAFDTIGPRAIKSWVREEPTSIFARRCWYLYEKLTGKTLDLQEVAPAGYADLLDSKLHVTGISRRSRRQLINDNLLGDANYCPLIRRTEALSAAMASGLEAQARNLIRACDPMLLARAVQYIYTKETKSSFAIEGEAPGADRTERFVAALSQAATFDTSDPQSFVRLQNAIVDPRYAEKNWRAVQNYVGQTMSDFREQVHYVCPKPRDVPDLMAGWMRLSARLQESGVDPVCTAAALSFGFVFIHPFEDGNGRIHRFLIHHALARSGFTPQGLLFPVSAVMLRDRRAYDLVLRNFSSAIQPFAEYTLDDNGQMTVRNETAPLYRYWDATDAAEYLYRCVAETVHRDLADEIDFLKIFDAAVRGTMNIVDMPDRRASFLVRLILQNKGLLSKAKRAQFRELRREEIAAIEGLVQKGMDKIRRPL